LFRSQESKVLGRDIGEGETGAIITVLHNDTDSPRGFGELLDDAFLQKWKTAYTTSFAGKQYNDGTAGLVVCGIEPVTEIEGPIGMRLIARIIMEMVNWHGEIVCGIEFLEIYGVASR